MKPDVVKRLDEPGVYCVKPHKWIKYQRPAIQKNDIEKGVTEEWKRNIKKQDYSNVTTNEQM